MNNVSSTFPENPGASVYSHDYSHANVPDSQMYGDEEDKQEDIDDGWGYEDGSYNWGS